MASETEMNLGCEGTLKVAYYQDNRLGNVNHAALAEAVATLPTAFKEGAGGKQIWLWLALPLIPAGFVTMAVVMFSLFAAGGVGMLAGATSADQAPDCGPMGVPGWFECNQHTQQIVFDEGLKNHEQAGTSMMRNFGISFLVMIAWFVSSVCLMCLRASAVSDGFEGLQRRLGELNQKMSPLNFSMRTDAQAYQSHDSGGDGAGSRTKIIYRYFLVIMNSTGGGGAHRDYPRTRGLHDYQAGEEENDEEESEEEEEEDDDESNSRRCIIS